MFSEVWEGFLPKFIDFFGSSKREVDGVDDSLQGLNFLEREGSTFSRFEVFFEDFVSTNLKLPGFSCDVCKE